MGCGSSVARGDGCDVVPVGGQVVEVAQEADVFDAALGLELFHHGQGLGGRLQGIPGGARNGFDQNRRPDLGRGLGRELEVVDRNGVLHHGVDAVLAKAVQGVERLAPELAPDLHCDGNVRPEIVDAGGKRDEAALSPGHVSGEEVEPDELNAGVADRSDKGVDILALGNRDVPRPPELHGLEAGVGGCLGPLEDGKLLEHDRTVDCVLHNVSFRLLAAGLASPDGPAADVMLSGFAGARLLRAGPDRSRSGSMSTPDADAAVRLSSAWARGEGWPWGRPPAPRRAVRIR